MAEFKVTVGAGASKNGTSASGSFLSVEEIRKRQQQKQKKENSTTAGIMKLGRGVYEFGKKDESKIKMDQGFWGGLGYVGASILAGFGGMMEGIGDLIGGTAALLSGDKLYAKYIFSKNTVGEWHQKIEDAYNPGAVMDFIGDVGQGIGNSAVMAVPYVGKVAFFAGAIGQGVGEAVQSTGKVGLKEYAYGATVGALEGVLESVIGAGGKAAKSLAGGALKSTVKNGVRNGVVKSVLSSAAGEFAEEFATEYASTFFKRAYQIDPNAQYSLRDAAYAGLVGFVSGGVMSGTTYGISAAVNERNGASIRERGNVNTLLNQANAVSASIPNGKKFRGDQALDSLRGSLNAYKTLEANGKAEGARGNMLLGEMQAAMTQVEVAAQVDDKVQIIKNATDAEVEAYAKAASQYLGYEVTPEMIRGDVDGAASSVAIVDFVNNMVRESDAERTLKEVSRAMKDKRTPVLEGGQSFNEDSAVQVFRVGDMFTAVVKNEGADGAVSYSMGLGQNADNMRIAQGLSADVVKRQLDKLARNAAAAQNASQGATNAQGVANDKGTQQNAAESEKTALAIEAANRSNQQTSADKRGRVLFERGARVTTKSQKRATVLAYNLAKALGIDIVFYDARNTADVNGRDANGYFDPKDDSIHLDLQKAAPDPKTIVFTLSHELTHFIKKWSAAKYETFANFLFDQYAKHGEDVDKMLAEKKEKLGEVSDEKVRDELIADACERLLLDSDAVNKLMELRRLDQSLFDKIKQRVKQILTNIRAAFKGVAPNTVEGRALQKMEDVLSDIYKMFEEAAVDAGRNYQEIGSRNLSELSEAVDTDGEPIFQYKAFKADENTYRSMLKKWGKMTDEQISNLFDTVNEAMDLIVDNLEVLDYAWESDIDDRAFSPVKPNSDKLYKVSLDFSTLCRKRILQQTVIAQLQEALDKPLSKEEGIAIRDALIALQEEGRQIEVACALCYVESARMKSPEQIKKFLNNREAVIKEFFAGKSGGSMKEKIAGAETAAREKLHKENPSGIKGKDGETMLDPREAKLNQLPKKYADEIRAAKKEAKESYKPTAEEQRVIDAAKGMSVSDFTTPEGLEKLAKSYPSLFDAYTSYVRNATKSKGIEGDTWWRAGDSESIGDVLIANMNKENGLRSQSWSDFQVVHILDYIAATIELATREAKEQAYSKVPDYVELMGKTGVMINMSLIPTAKFDGKLDYDSVEGMAYKRAIELRDKYPETAGTICIGIQNEQIRMLLADSTIDYVIPYHKSGMSAVTRKKMRIPTWENYEDYQREDKLSRADALKNAKRYGVKLLDESDPNYQKGTSFSEWFDLKEAQQIAKMENANPTDQAKYKKYGVMYGGYMAMQNAAKNYLKLCAERGLSPKFSHEKADFTSEENYWKLLIDRKMVNNKTGDIIEQMPIKPIFEQSEVMRILNDELARYPSVKEDQEYAIRKVTEKFLSGDVKGGMSAEAIAKVMKKPVDNVTKVNILESADDGGVMKQLKYERAIDLLDSEKLDRPQNTHIEVLDHTPQIYIDKANAQDMKIIMGWDIAYLAMKKSGELPGNYHGLGAEAMKQIPNALKDPLYIVKQDNGRIAVITELIVKTNRSILVSIELSDFKTITQEGTLSDGNYNVIVTVMDAQIRYLKNNIFGGEIVYNKNEETPAHFILRLKSLKKALPTNDLAEVSNKSIPQDSDSVKKQMKKTSDKDYIDAVNRGDMTTAQRMVDEAASKAMPDTILREGKAVNKGEDPEGTLVKMYHGSGSKGFHSFKMNDGALGKGVYLSSNFDEAVGYAMERLGIEETDDGTYTWNGEEYDGIGAIGDALEAEGYVRAFYANVTDASDITHSSVYWEDVIALVRDAGGIKSADPVTYDDRGKVIPLSERFNSENDDIRYQKKNTAAKQQTGDENAKNSRDFNAQEDVFVEKAYSYNDAQAAIRNARRALEIDTTINGDEQWKVYMSREALGEATRRVWLAMNEAADAEHRDKLLGRVANIVMDRATFGEIGGKRRIAARSFEYDTKTEGEVKESVVKALIMTMNVRGDASGDVVRKQNANITGAKSSIKTAKNTASLRGQLEKQKAKTLAERAKANKFNRENPVKERAFRNAKFLADMVSKRDYLASSMLENEEMKAAIKPLTKIKSTYQLQKNGGEIRRIVRDFGVAFYNSKNDMLTDANKKTTEDGEKWVIRPEIVEDIALLAKNAESDADLTIDEFEAVDRILQEAARIYREYGTAVVNGRRVVVKQIAKETYEDLQRSHASASGKVKSGAIGWLRKLGEVVKKVYTYQIIDPRSVIRAMEGYSQNGFLSQLFDDVRLGEVYAKKTLIDLVKPMEDFFKENKGYEKRLKNAKINFDGHEMSVGQAISLYELSKRDQAKYHLSKGGIKWDGADGEIRELKTITERQLDEIKRQLTEKDHEYIKLVEDFFNRRAKAVKEEADGRILGYTNTVGGHYFPIKVDQTEIPMDISNLSRVIQQQIMTVYNASFNKNTVKDAQNQVIVNNVFDVVYGHARMLSNYAQLYLPMTAFSKVYNARVEVAPGTQSTVRKYLERVWRQNGKTQSDGFEKYMSRLFADLQGIGKDKNSIERVIETVRGGWFTATLGLNVGTAAKQITSLPMALAHPDVDMDSFMRAFALPSGKAAMAEMDKYCALAYDKHYEGGAAAAIGVIDKVRGIGQKTMFMIEGMDRQLTCRIWCIAQMQILKDKGFAIGSEENKVAAGELAMRIMFDTQSGYTVTERSGAMRSTSELVRAMTMFTSDAMKHFSRIVDAFGEMEACKRRVKLDKSKANVEAWRQSKKQVGKVIGAHAASTALLVAMTQLFKWLYDKDREEGETLAEDVIKDAISSELGMLPGVSDVVSFFIDGYDVSHFSYDMLNDVLGNVRSLGSMAAKAVNGESVDSTELNKQLRLAVFNLGSLTGIPVKNVHTTVYGLTKRFDSATAYKYNALFYDPRAKDLTEALKSGDERLATTIYDILLSEKAGEAEEVAVKTMLSLYRDGYDTVMPKSIPDEITVKGKTENDADVVVALKAAQKKRFAQVYGKASGAVSSLIANEQFATMEQEAQADAIRMLYDAYYNEAAHEVAGVERSKVNVLSSMVDREVLVLSRAVISTIEADKDKKGNTVSGSRKKKVLEYVKTLKLPKGQAEIVLYLNGYRGDAIETAVTKYANSAGLDEQTLAELAEMMGGRVVKGKIVLK